MLAQPCIDKRIGPQFRQSTVPANGPFDWFKASRMNAHGPFVSHYPNANSISDTSVLHGSTLGPNPRSRNAPGPNRTPFLLCCPGWVWELSNRRRQSMIPKSGNRFSEKDHAQKKLDHDPWFNLIGSWSSQPVRFSCGCCFPASQRHQLSFRDSYRKHQQNCRHPNQS